MGEEVTMGEVQNDDGHRLMGEVVTMMMQNRCGHRLMGEVVTMGR